MTLLGWTGIEILRKELYWCFQKGSLSYSDATLQANNLELKLYFKIQLSLNSFLAYRMIQWKQGKMFFWSGTSKNCLPFTAKMCGLMQYFLLSSCQVFLSSKYSVRFKYASSRPMGIKWGSYSASISLTWININIQNKKMCCSGRKSPKCEHYHSLF